MMNEALVLSGTIGSRKPLAIFDLDGTLANLDHRLHFIQKEKPDWDSFNSNVSDDAPIYPIIVLAQTLLYAEWEIEIWTGRMDTAMHSTIVWLKQYNLEKYLYRMRPEGEFMPDTELKRGWLHDLSADERDRLQFVVDDRSSVVAMWREEGVMCLQCNQWEEYKYVKHSEEE